MNIKVAAFTVSEKSSNTKLIYGGSEVEIFDFQVLSMRGFQYIRFSRRDSCYGKGDMSVSHAFTATDKESIAVCDCKI